MVRSIPAAPATGPALGLGIGLAYCGAASRERGHPLRAAVRADDSGIEIGLSRAPLAGAASGRNRPNIVDHMMMAPRSCAHVWQVELAFRVEAGEVRGGSAPPCSEPASSNDPRLDSASRRFAKKEVARTFCTLSRLNRWRGKRASGRTSFPWHRDEPCRSAHANAWRSACALSEGPVRARRFTITFHFAP